MVRAKQFLSTLFFSKFFWQLILSVFMIGLAVFFIRHEQVEVIQIRNQLAESNSWYILLGIILTLIYIFLQAMMYVHSFRATGKNISKIAAVRLFLKRNLISVFLPAGGFTSLAFFTRDLDNEEVTKSQIHLASTLYGIISIMSVVLVAVPVLGIALLMIDFQKTELLGFLFLLLLSVFLVLLLFSLAKKGRMYRWISRIKPSFILILDEMIANKINRKEVWLILFFSTLIEFSGILHLYIAMLALGFEASLPAAIIGYMVMIVILIASPFLRGLGAIEVSLTYLLRQFGFPVFAAASITLLFRFFEFWLPLIFGLFSFITRKDNLILRILPAFIIFILGIVNIVSALTPAIPARLRLMQEIFPENMISTSVGFIMVFGLLLIILSVFLLQGSKRAWSLGIALTLLSILGHLIKSADYEEAILSFVAFASLFYTRKFYKLKPHPKFTRISFAVLIYSVLALIIIGSISFYFIDRRHFGIDFEFWQSVKTILRLFFLLNASGLEPETRFATEFLHAIYVSGGLVLVFIFYSLLRPIFGKPFNSAGDRELASELVKKYGNSTLDYFKIYPDKFFFFTNDKDGFISFKVTRHFAFVLENPVCKDEVAMVRLITEFEKFCEENGFVNVFYRIPGNTLDVYKRLGKKSFPIGEEAVVDLTVFTLSGQKIRTTRSAINRLSSEGFEMKVYIPPIKEGLLQKLEHVSDSWLEEMHQKEIAFTQGVFDRNILKNNTIITIEDKEEKVYAFLNLIPDYVPGEATYDLIRKVPEAPNGVLDMLLAKTLLYFKELGYQSANIGMAPLSGIDGATLSEKSLKYAYENLRPLGHFKGLRKYKEKFFPTWEKRYLIYSHDFHLLQIPGALKRVSEGS